MTDLNNTAFQLALDFVNYTSAPVFLTGKAGTGKTTFLKCIKEKKIKNTVVVAPTGVAAINAGGTTIHSFFQLPFTPFIPASKGFGTGFTSHDKHSLISRLKLTADRREVMQQLELLIIDEISMVRCDVLDAIDTILRHVCNRQAIPFGGVQVLFIGDMYQLAPVIKNDEWELLAPYYKSQYFFHSYAIASQPPVYIELNNIYRQKDEAFVELLNQVRNNEMSERGYKLLHTRYLPHTHPPKEENFITLTTHNSKADAINFKALNELQGKVYSFKALIEGEFYEKSYPADVDLKLKAGTQVMFLKNDTEKVRRYFNGKIGVVEKIENDTIFVLCKGDAAAIEVKKEKWQNIRYRLDKATNLVEEDEVGSFTQFPLRQAWAITIHKSQGLTFEKAIIDAGEAFAPGQVYVALSRCTGLQGIILHSRINNNSLRNDYRIAAFATSQHTTSEQTLLLHQAKQRFQQDLLLSLFDFSELQLSVKSLASFLAVEANGFNKEVMQWIGTVANVIEKIAAVSMLFLPQLKMLLGSSQLPEENEALQKRLIAASNHFCDALQKCQEQITICEATCDSKDVASHANKMLSGLYTDSCLRKHLFEGCRDGFTVIHFQQQKRLFIKPTLPVNMYAGKSSYKKTDSPYPELYKQLRKKRDEICEEKMKPVFMVANSTSLDEMARFLPQTFDELNKISGFGAAKTAQFGEVFLSVINQYCEANNLHTNMDDMPVKEKRRRKTKS